MDGELSGYLDVKVPSQVRKRGLTPWKTWKRQWCAVRRCEDSEVEVQLGGSVTNCLQIPTDSILCRSDSRSRQFAFGVFHRVGQALRPFLFLAGSSESDSQHWMARIRSLMKPPQHFDIYAQYGDTDFCVSLVDNPHSHAAGLAGFHGKLSIGPDQVSLYEPFQEEVKLAVEWAHIEQCNLAVTGKAEDENRICVIHTTSEFCAGTGQLYLFCKQAPRMLRCLLRRGHGSPSPRPLGSGRRLSRSESDLRCYWSVEEASPSSSDFLRRPVLMRSHSGSRDSGVRVSTASDDSGHALRGKIASGLISAGLGLLFSTPGCSEADNESLHEYQHIGSFESDEDVESVGALYRTNSTSYAYSPRRESGISLASGIYEEISDDVLPAMNDDEVQNHYENPATLGWGTGFVRSASPPPLPPRKQHSNQMGSLSEEALDEKSRPCCRVAGSASVRPSPLSHFQTYSASCSALTSGLPSAPSWDHWPPARRRLLTEPEPDYVPMSPGGSSVISPAPLEEQHYMVMASLNTS